MENNFSLTDLGFDSDFEESWQKYQDSENVSLARVSSEHKEAYTIKDTEGEYFATITGKKMFEAHSRIDYPAVGDWVVIEKTAEDKATITAVLPRKTILKKKHSNREDIQIIATNVDYAFVVETLGRDFNLNRFERYFTLAAEGGVQPVAILNKTDLIPEAELEAAKKELRERFVDIEVLSTSAETGEGMDTLQAFITTGKTYCFLGSSGVGKSSLINGLMNSDALEVGEIGGHSKRGKHTTTRREMFVLENGGIVIDNPGTREVGVVETSSGIEDVFEDLAELSHTCKYTNCTHVHEPGCAVLEALQAGDVAEDRYQNFLRLKKENAYYEMTDFQRRDKDKKFGKFIKKSKGDIKKFKNR